MRVRNDGMYSSRNPGQAGRGLRRICVVLYVEGAARGEQGPVAGVSGRHYAVEHIDPGAHSFDQVFRSADPHHVPGRRAREAGVQAGS